MNTVQIQKKGSALKETTGTTADEKNKEAINYNNNNNTFFTSAEP